MDDFLSIINKYDSRDLFTLLILVEPNINKNEILEEEYSAMKNLLGRILIYKKNPNGERINFNDFKNVNKILGILIDYLKDKYEKDFKELFVLKNNNIISEKQLNYELGSPKTYPKIFVDTIKDKLVPFKSFLKNKYGISLEQIQKDCEKIIKNFLNLFTLDDILKFRPFEITNYFNKKFLEDLVEINESERDLLSIKTFSKNICFPAIKIENKFYITSGELFIDNFYNAVHRLCYKNFDKYEKDKVGNEKGKNFNIMCETLFKDGFNFSEVYSNCTYENGEIDLIIREKDLLILVECKSRNYTDKISGVSRSYLKANKNNLDDASMQLNRFINKLNIGRVRVETKSGALNINKSDYNYILPIVINIANMAELNADYEKRNLQTIFISYDDLQIIFEVINNKKWLLVDFLSQINKSAIKDSAADDVIDMFAFYCKTKNVSILFNKNEYVIVYKLGNDYFQKYFSYMVDENPLYSFDNDISTYAPNLNEPYSKIINSYHNKYSKTLNDFIKDS